MGAVALAGTSAGVGTASLSINLSSPIKKVKGIAIVGDFDGGGSGIRYALCRMELGDIFLGDQIQMLNIAGAIQSERRDGKIVSLLGAVGSGTGIQGTSKFATNAWSVSGSDLLGTLIDMSGSAVEAPSGVKDLPPEVLIAYKLS